MRKLILFTVTCVTLLVLASSSPAPVENSFCNVCPPPELEFPQA